MDKKRNGTRFNAFDLLILLIIAGMVALVIWNKEIKELTDNTERAEIVYSFTVKNVENGREMYLKEGTGLKAFGSGDTLGTVRSFASEYSIMTVTLVDGTSETVQLKDKKDVRCTVKMTAVKKDTGYFTESGEIIVPGKVFKAETDRAVFEIKIESVSDRASDINVTSAGEK